MQVVQFSDKGIFLSKQGGICMYTSTHQLAVIKLINKTTIGRNSFQMCIFVYQSRLVLAWVPGVSGTRGFFRPYCLAPADFGRSVNPIQTRYLQWAYYAHHITTWHPWLHNPNTRSAVVSFTFRGFFCHFSYLS